jgi:hypothetical protein
MTLMNRSSSMMMVALFGAAALSLTALGCEGEKGGPAAGGSSAPAAAAKPGEKPAAAAAKVELEEVKNEKMGYTLKLPKGASTSMSDENGGMYMHDTMIISVGPVGVAIANADDVLRGVSTEGGTVEKKTEGDAFIAIVTKPNSPINIYAGPKGAKIASHCMAEPSMKDLGIQICASLKSTE